MKILFTSDLHGLKEAFVRFSEILQSEDYDLGILSGDLMTYTPDMKETEKEIKEILNQVKKPILFVMGNDDGILGYNWTDTEYLTNIDLKKVIIKGQSFAGYQYTNPYVGGPFEKSEEEQEKDLPALAKLINIDTIFVSHGPALGILDKTHEDISVGSRALRKIIDSQQPKLHVFGHIHQSHGLSDKAINGAYPYPRKFVSIDLETMKFEFLE